MFHGQLQKEKASQRLSAMKAPAAAAALGKKPRRIITPTAVSAMVTARVMVSQLWAACLRRLP